MDTTIRNLDEDVYRRLKAWAALQGKSVGATLSEILRHHFERQSPLPKTGVHLWDLPSWDFGPGSERLSEEIDDVLYGRKDDA